MGYQAKLAVPVPGSPQSANMLSGSSSMPQRLLAMERIMLISNNVALANLVSMRKRPIAQSYGY